MEQCIIRPQSLQYKKTREVLSRKQHATNTYVVINTYNEAQPIFNILRSAKCVILCLNVYVTARVIVTFTMRPSCPAGFLSRLSTSASDSKKMSSIHWSPINGFSLSILNPLLWFSTNSLHSCTNNNFWKSSALPACFRHGWFCEHEKKERLCTLTVLAWYGASSARSTANSESV